MCANRWPNLHEKKPRKSETSEHQKVKSSSVSKEGTMQVKRSDPGMNNNSCCHQKRVLHMLRSHRIRQKQSHELLKASAQYSQYQLAAGSKKEPLR
jgi:hypothetical protein